MAHVWHALCQGIWNLESAHASQLRAAHCPLARLRAPIGRAGDSHAALGVAAPTSHAPWTQRVAARRLVHAWIALGLPGPAPTRYARSGVPAIELFCCAIAMATLPNVIVNKAERRTGRVAVCRRAGLQTCSAGWALRPPGAPRQRRRQQQQPQAAAVSRQLLGAAGVGCLAVAEAARGELKDGSRSVAVCSAQTQSLHNRACCPAAHAHAHTPPTNGLTPPFVGRALRARWRRVLGARHGNHRLARVVARCDASGVAYTNNRAHAIT